MINYVWLRDETRIDELVNLFLTNATEEYITTKPIINNL